jgi:hypothetical protein
LDYLNAVAVPRVDLRGFWVLTQQKSNILKDDNKEEKGLIAKM